MLVVFPPSLLQLVFSLLLLGHAGEVASLGFESGLFRGHPMGAAKRARWRDMPKQYSSGVTR